MPTSDQHHTDAWFFHLALVLLLALAVRLAALHQLRATPYFDHLIIDARSYDAWAQRLAAGDWVGTKPYCQTPVYPHFLGVLYALFGRNLLLPRLIQILLGTATCALIYFIAGRLFSRRVALFAALFAALYRPFVFQEIMLLKSALLIFLTSAALLLLLRAGERKGLASCFAAGFVFAIAAIDRGQLFLFAPLAALWLWKEAGKGKRGLLCGGIFVAAVACAIVPVTIRNYIVSGDFVLTIAESPGLNFYEGNNPNATGIHNPAPMVRTVPEREPEDARRFVEKELGRRVKLSEVSGFYFGLGLRFMREQPLKFLRLLGRKFLLFWNAYEVPDNYNLDFMIRFIPVLRVAVFSFGIIAPLALLGIFTMERSRGEWLLVLFVASYMVGVVIFYITARYRLPVVVGLIPFAAVAVLRLWDGVREKRWSRLATQGLLLLVLAVFVNIPLLPKNLGFARELCFLGNFKMEDGDFNGAVMELRRAAELSPREPAIIFNLAKAEYLRGNRDESRRLLELILRIKPDFKYARRELRRLSERPDFDAAMRLIRQGKLKEAREKLEIYISQNPDDADALNNLGAVLMELKEYERAIEVLRKATELEPDDYLIWNNLGLAYKLSGDEKRAKEAWAESLYLNPSQNGIRKKLKSLSR